MSSLTKRRTTSLTQEVIADLTHQIKSGALKVGDKLPTEAELIRQQGVSRTVVREAISHLQAAGLIETQHGIGSFVLSTDSSHANFRIDPNLLTTIQDLLQVLELRQSLECSSASMAAQRRTEQDLQDLQDLLDEFELALNTEQDTSDIDFRFHLAIAKATGNPYFVNFMSYLGKALIPRTQIRQDSFQENASLTEYLQRVHKEHEAIYRAIVDQNPSLAASTMQIHISNSMQRLRTRIQNK